MRIIKIWLAIRIRRLRPYLLTKKEQEKLSILELRGSFSFFGFDISNMSDEEIKQGVITLAKEMSKIGLSASEASKALSRMCI